MELEKLEKIGSDAENLRKFEPRPEQRVLIEKCSNKGEPQMAVF